jgi:hypothetical protein
MNEIYQHNFKTIKPESVFTSRIVDPQMCEDIEKEIREMGDRQDHKTNVKAQMTEWQMQNKPGFKVLTEKILDMAEFISKKYYNRPMKGRIADMWGMLYKKGDHAIVHDHWPALWSGVYYLKVPNNSGELYFPQLKQSFMPNENQLVLFNGSTRHGVKENLNGEERICVSFNIKEDLSV